MQITTLTFDISCHPGQLTNFRACIAELADMHPLFHNHHKEEGPSKGYLNWEYPLIQYTIRGGKPAIIGIGEGATLLQQLAFKGLPDVLTFAGKTHFLKGYRFQQTQYIPQVLPNAKSFGLHGWIALNNSNYKDWKVTHNKVERQFILNRCLTGHLRSLAERMEVPNYKHIHAEVLQIDNQKRVYWRNVPLVRFHVLCSSNFLLPTSLHLGRLAAFGYGEVITEETYNRLLAKNIIQAPVHYR